MKKGKEGTERTKKWEICGPEGVHAEMLKHGTNKLIKMLTWVIDAYMEKKLRNNGKLLTFHQYTKKEAKKIVLTIGAFQ